MEVKYGKILEVVKQAGIPESVAQHIFGESNPEVMIDIEDAVSTVNGVAQYGIETGYTQLFYSSIAHECYRENKSYIDEFAQNILSDEARCEWLNTSFKEEGNLNQFEYKITINYVEYCCDKLKNHLSIEMFENNSDDKDDSSSDDSHYHQERMF